MTRKLRLRLALIAALPEPILRERLKHLPKVELIAFRRRYGIRECRLKGRCKIKYLRTIWDAGDNSSSSQTCCQCAAARQAIPPIPFSAHQLLAKLLKTVEGERGPNQPRQRPNRNRKIHAA
ncbi:MAG: hypothetical protein L0215_02825 [Gemmataceae bacterium]|nr:hypothetical protein [Gemmataceae bacterium]